MAFDWGTDVGQPVEDAIGRLDDYNSNPFDAATNPKGLGQGGHITNFPAALTDTAVVANGFSSFADLMETYASSASQSAIDAAQSANNLSATSTSSVSLSTGAKSFVTQAGKTFPEGSYLLVTSDANPSTHWMVLRVSAYSGTALSGVAVTFSGSGARADWTIRPTGVPVNPAALAYLWSTSTTATDPSAGRIKLNNAAVGSATAVYISETDADGNSLSAIIATWDDGTGTVKGRLFIRATTQPSNFAIVDLTGSLTDNGTWQSSAIVPVSSGGTLSDGMQVLVAFNPVGEPGAIGPAGPSYAATSTTSLAIGTGSKTFTTQAGLAYQVGTRARATDVGNAVNWIEGVVTSYSGSTLTINADSTSGAGTVANWNISVAGERGTTGATGAGGDDAGFEYQFNSTTSVGDPGTGKFIFNAAFMSATQWAVSETDNNGNSIGPLFAALDDGTGTNKILVFAIKQGSGAYAAWYVTSTLTDQGTYDVFNITPISTSGSFVNNDTFHLITIPLQKGDAGTAGIAGPTTAPVWNFNSATSASDPGSSNFKLNNATISSVTALYISETDGGGSDLSSYLMSWDDSTNSAHRGTLYIIQTNDSSKYAIFTVGTVTDSGAFENVALTYVAGPGGFTSGQSCAFSFTRSGNAGAGSGDVVGPASATNNGIALFDGGTGKLIKSSAAVGALAYLASVGNAEIGAGAVTADKLAAQAAGSVLANTTGGAASPIVVDIDTTFKTALALAKADVGLGNVDNTSDAAKPISTAQAAVNALKKFASVRAATTANITIATALNNGDVIDGVTLADGQVVLVKNQSSAAENGIYVVGASPARHTEFDAYDEYPGLNVTVQEGTINADTLWNCSSNIGGTIGSTAIAFSQLAVTPYTAHATLTLTANQFALNLANANIWTASQTFINSSGIKIQDTNASHTLGLIVGSDLTADRTLTLTTGDANRVISLGGNLTTGGAFTTSGAFAVTLTFTGTTTVTFPTTGTLATTDAASLTTGTLPDARLSSAATPYGKQKFPMAADYWLPKTAPNGPTLATTTGTNNERRSANFDQSTQQDMYATISMPNAWNEGTITFDVDWEHPTTSTNFGVAFDLAAVAQGDNEGGDQAFGTAVVVTDTGGIANNNYKTTESGAITVAGSPAAGDFVNLRFRRMTGNVADNLAVVARVKSVNIYFTTDQGHD